MKKIKVVLVQSNIIFEDKKANIEKARLLVERYNYADLILFPEMSFTGFSMNTSLTKEIDETLEYMRNLSMNNSVAVGFGWVCDCGDGCENRYTIVDCKGDILSNYAKIHPFSFANEDKFFISGKRPIIFHIDDIPFSTFICYDIRFPELFRTVCDKIHAVIIPANWPEKRSKHWNALLKARAIENQIYIFAINCVGYMDGQYYSGDSCVISPNGEVIDLLSDKEGTIEFDFLDDVEITRNAFPVLNDKKIVISLDNLISDH